MRSAICGWAIGLAVGAGGALAAEPQRFMFEPGFVVEPCCDLCPAAAQRGAYNTRSLQAFATLVEGRDGWLFRTQEDLRMAFGPGPEGHQHIQRLHGALKSRGIELVIVYPPTRAMMHPDKLPGELTAGFAIDRARASYAQALAKFRADGIVAPDLSALADAPAEQPYYFRGDHHWTPYGAQRTAKLVADAIKALPVYAQLPKQRFVTERVGTLARTGTMHKAAAQICGFGFPNQYVDHFVTVADGGDLFAEPSMPPVVLLGTGASAGPFNFSGFLAEYLGADVLNAAVPGSGFGGALIGYFPSAEFQKNPPKVIVWEIEPYQNFDNRGFFRQTIPLVQNGCEGKRAVLSATKTLQGEHTEVLFNGKGKTLPLKGRNHLLDVRFGTRAVRDFKAIVWYTNGSKEALDLHRPDGAPDNGRFAVELRDDGDWGNRTFMSLDVATTAAAPAGTEVTAKVCPRDAGPAPTQQAER